MNYDGHPYSYSPAVLRAKLVAISSPDYRTRKTDARRGRQLEMKCGLCIVDGDPDNGRKARREDDTGTRLVHQYYVRLEGRVRAGKGHVQVFRDQPLGRILCTIPSGYLCSYEPAYVPQIARHASEPPVLPCRRCHMIH